MSCVRKGYNTFMAEHWKNISVFAELFRQIVLGRFDLRMYEGLGQMSTSPSTSNWYQIRKICFSDFQCCKTHMTYTKHTVSILKGLKIVGLANMSFCLNWGQFPGSIDSAQGNTLQSMEDLSSTTGSSLNTIHIMVTGPPWRVINEWESSSLAIMDMIGHPAVKARIFFTIAQRDHGTIFMGVCNEHVSQMMPKDIRSLSFETGSEFLQQLYLPKASTVARTRNISLSWQSSIISLFPFSAEPGDQKFWSPKSEYETIMAGLPYQLPCCTTWGGWFWSQSLTPTELSTYCSDAKRTSPFLQSAAGMRMDFSSNQIIHGFLYRTPGMVPTISSNNSKGFMDDIGPD